MPLPPDGPATLAGARAQLAIPEDDTRSDAALTGLVSVVNTLLAGWPCTTPAADAEDWTGDNLAPVVTGANMLVARLYQRRNSPLGFEQIGELGPVYVSRNDPDLAMLLGLGTWQTPTNLVG